MAQQQGVAYFNAPRVMANNNQQQEAVASAPQQAAAQQPALLPPQQYFIPNGLYPTLPVQQQQGSSVPQQQAYLIYPSIQGMPPQQVPIQYVLQQAPPVAQIAPQQVAVPQASAGIASSQLSGCCSRICQRLKKGCNARKAVAFLAIGSFVLHAVLTPLSFPWFLLVWMLLALIIGTKKINRKFAAMADDDERKGHKCFATHTLWFLVLNSFTVFLNLRCCHFPWAAYPVLIWGMFYAMHGIRRFAPHKNTAITKHAIVFVTLQLLLFITWAYAHRAPQPPRYSLGANGPQPPRPAPGRGAEAPVQGYEGEQHPHHGMGGGRHHHGGRHGGKRWGGRRFGHKHGDHKQHHGPHQPAAEAPVQAYAEGRMMNPQPQQNPQPAPAPAPAPQPPTPSSAPVTPKPGKPVQPNPQPQPPKDKKMPPPNHNNTHMPPPRPRRVFPVLLWLIPSLILTIAFVIHLKVHKRRQAAAEAQASQVEAPVQPVVAQQPAVHEAVAPMAPEHTAV